MGFFKGEEPAPITGRRARPTNMVRVYGIQEMADELKDAKKSFFRTNGGTRYAVGVNKEGDPTNLVRIGKDPRPPKLRKRLRREARFLKQQAKLKTS